MGLSHDASEPDAWLKREKIVRNAMIHTDIHVLDKVNDM